MGGVIVRTMIPWVSNSVADDAKNAHVSYLCIHGHLEISMNFFESSQALPELAREAASIIREVIDPAGRLGKGLGPMRTRDMIVGCYGQLRECRGPCSLQGSEHWQRIEAFLL